MRSRRIGTVVTGRMALGWSLLAIAALSGCRESETSAHPVRESPVEVVSRMPHGVVDVPGDIVNGARLYRVHCSSCHGTSGQGDGPAASYMYPVPRAHTDPAYMNRRSNEELHEAITGGGPAVGLSPLMPRWDETFGRNQIWDLVAHVRSLYQPIHVLVPKAKEVGVTDVALSDAVFSEVGGASQHLAPGSRKVTFYSVASTAGTSGPVRVIFGNASLHARKVPLGLAIDDSGRVLKVRTFPQVVLHHRGFRLVHTVDRFLDSLTGQPIAQLRAPEDRSDERALVAPSLIATVRHLAHLLTLARRQDAVDAAEAKSRKETLAKDPSRLPEGERLFLSACAACHGSTGKGGRVPGAFAGLRSRNLSDGAHLNRLSDENLLFLFHRGGEKARLSPAMPGFGATFTDAQYRQILAYVRSLARPGKEVAGAP